MLLREEQTYKALRAEWLICIDKAYHPGKGVVVAEVDNLMMASFRFMRIIRNHLSRGSVEIDTITTVPLLPQALKKARAVISSQDGLSSLFSEMESLEALSRSAYHWLKDTGRLVGAQ